MFVLFSIVQSTKMNLRQWLVYVFKHDPHSAMLDPYIFQRVGFPLGFITTNEQLLKWFKSGEKTKSCATDEVIALIESGMDERTIMTKYKRFYFHQQKKLLQYKMKHDSLQPFQFIHPSPIDMELLDGYHRTAKAIAFFYNRTFCGLTVSKGHGWLHIWGPSNALKSFFIAKTIKSIFVTSTLVFNGGWVEGFRENGQQVLYVDGLTEETIKNGFSGQLMEHCTVGTDDRWTFPKKYSIVAPSTNGEVMVSTGNRKMLDIVGPLRYDTIVRERVCEVEVRAETNLFGLTNIIRASANLPPVPRPVVTSPNKVQFTQPQSQ